MRTRPALPSLLLVALCGCHRAPPPALDAPVASLTPEWDDAVVATVDGRPIYAGAVAQQARAKGCDVKTALSDLIDAEVLAGEADRRGLRHDLDARLDAKGAMVRRYLHDTFEHDVTPADVAWDRVRRAYVRNKEMLNHDTYIDVWHILAPTGDKAPPDLVERSRAVATDLAQRGKGGTLEQFKALADATPWEMGPLKSEEIITEKDGWTQKSFSEGAFARLHKPGDTTVVQTTYGYHALYLIGFKPPQHTPIEAVEQQLRVGVFESETQKAAFAHFVDEAMARHRIEEHPEHLPKDEP